MQRRKVSTLCGWWWVSRTWDVSLICNDLSSTAIYHTVGSYAIFPAITLQSMPSRSMRMVSLWAAGTTARLTSGTMRAATAFRSPPLSPNPVGLAMQLLWKSSSISQLYDSTIINCLFSAQAPWMLSVGYMLLALTYRAGKWVLMLLSLAVDELIHVYLHCKSLDNLRSWQDYQDLERKYAFYGGVGPHRHEGMVQGVSVYEKVLVACMIASTNHRLKWPWLWITLHKWIELSNLMLEI